MMKTIFRKSVTLLLSFLCLNNLFAQSAPTFGAGLDPIPSGKQWVKVDGLTDEFNVNGLDTTKWTKSTWNYEVPVEMVADNTNSGVWGGYMWIRATLDNSAERWFRSARIMSKEKISYPMYTESKIKASSISAYTTYWLNNGDINNRDEIDIIENNAKPTCGCQPDFPWQMNSQYFQADQTKTPETVRKHGNFDNRNLSSGNPLKGVKWDADYHIFGAYWSDARNVQFFLDGEPAGSIYVGDHLDGVTYNRQFTRDLNVIFDLWTNEADWLGGLAVKSDLNNNAKNTMYVDWVRTWSIEDAPASTKYFLVNRETGKKVRTNGSAENTPLELVPSTWSGAPTQWEKIATDNGWFYLKNVANGMYFRPTNDTENSVLIQKPTSYDGSYTQWKIISSSGGYFYLQNRATGDYFRPETTSDYSAIIQKSTSSTNNWTQWALIPVSSNGSVANPLSELTIENTKVANTIQIYPNPLKNENLYINVPNQSKTYTVQVFDAKGSTVLQTSITGDYEINRSVFSGSGLYFVNVIGNDINKITKIIVE